MVALFVYFLVSQKSRR